ncbi:hypothetical protein CFP65_4262 [Kitasatospora sp. MMS16-BH015]|uniref:hypothetical protein n=1 Tax=Kitasatospora sp. MMS16-BH015 TaxID=2018025 RepID=UPI000CA1416E|nr:hypothetical protein [Kitasatospora sp. MMS16-BH015]AUG79016.1 hypothetical protein CFP65_4262 [Kitasatospora sp. MMS16-BH015]
MTQTAQTTTALVPGQRTASPVPAALVPAAGGDGVGSAVRRAVEIARSVWRLRPVAAAPVQAYGECDGQ